MAAQDYEVYRPPAQLVSEEPARADSSRPARRPAWSAGCGGTEAKRQWLTVSTICVAIWLMTGGGYFWPVWPMLGLGIPVLLSRR